MMRQTLSWFTPPPVSKSLTTDSHYGAPDGSAAIATSLIGVPSARSQASTSATLRVVLIVTFRPEFEAPWIGRPYVTCLTINRLAAREVGAMIDGVIGNRLLAPNMRLASQPSEKGPKR